MNSDPEMKRADEQHQNRNKWDSQQSGNYEEGAKGVARGSLYFCPQSVCQSVTQSGRVRRSDPSFLFGRGGWINVAGLCLAYNIGVQHGRKRKGKMGLGPLPFFIVL